MNKITKFYLISKNDDIDYKTVCSYLWRLQKDTREITEYDGNVTFSVRFYNTEKENDIDYLEYSWSTLNTTIKINPSLDLDIILSDNKASYEVSGNEKFKTGRNVVTITVTAEDGSTRVYTINVNKEDVKDVASDEEVSNSSRVVIIILIILVIIGLIYVIFKDDEEEERENNDKESKN